MGAATSHFNVALRVYKPDRSLAAELDRDSMLEDRKCVNEPTREIIDSDQVSPAVDIDPCGNIVVTWVGPVLHSASDANEPCTEDDDLAVYARRLYYDDSSGTLEFKSQEFRVDTSGDWKLGSTLEDVHPTVALRQLLKFQDPGGLLQVQGAFIVGWNAILRSGTQKSVRGQFYHPDGRPYGTEFDLSPFLHQVSEELVPDGINRTLAESSQHTLMFGQTLGGTEHGEVYATWTATDGSDSDVWFTQVGGGFADAWETAFGACIKGDCDGDGTVLGDIDDIAPFVAILLDDDHSHNCEPYDLIICQADTNNDGVTNGLDIQCFVTVHLVMDATCDESERHNAVACGADGFEAPEIVDCDENGISDTEDLVRGAADCNGNGVPDDCDIANETSNDLNEDGMPDECETDCNRNGIPDDFDLAEETSEDVNGNDIPDECETDCNNNDLPDAWEISEAISPDCNSNGVPDDCEYDCNSNGVPDDCDIDPLDPDGDEQVSEDCNNDRIPDECDLARSLLPSFDCNMNGIPDECEIANETAEDCNENGLLDECEIAWHIVADTNENGIPDPCEEEMMMGRGESEGGESSPSAEAYTELFDWMLEQEWGPNASTTTAEQFAAYAAKCAELGLPVMSPQLALTGP